MNTFKHYARLLVSREVAFRLTQEEAYKNLTEVVVPMLESGGVMGDLLGTGLIPGDNLQVKFGVTQQAISIRPGIAIILGAAHYDTEVIVLPSEIEVTIDDHIDPSEAYTGLALVYIDHSSAPVASGNETFKPGQIPGSSHIYMLEEDSYSVTIVKEVDKSDSYGLLLANIYVEYSGGSHQLVYAADVAGTVNMSVARPFVDTDDIGSLTTAGIGAITLGDIDLIKVGNELMTVSAYTTEIFTVIERGSSNSDDLLHRNGVVVTVSPIVDMRQINVARFKRGDARFEALLKAGVINYGEGAGDRWLKTQKIADTPGVPYIKEGSISLVWLNQVSTGFGKSSTVKELVNEASSAKSRMEFLTSDINASRRALIEETDEGEKTSIQESLAESQLELADVSVRKNELTAQVSKVYDVISPANKKYAAIITFEQPTLIDDEQIVQYEAEVTYKPKGSVGVIDNQAIKSQIFSKLLTPDGINSYGDKTYDYDSMPAEEFRRLVIPMQPNERISVRVRSVTEDRMVSVWSDAIEYDFEELGKNEISLSIEIDELLSPAASYLDATITTEMVAFLNDLKDQFLAGLVEVRGIHAELEALQTEYTALAERVRLLEIDNGANNGRIDLLVEAVNAPAAT